MAYEEDKPAHERMACPHCGKMISGKTKTDVKCKVTEEAAKKQALVGKVKKGLHAAFPKDTNASDQVSEGGDRSY